MVAVSRCTAALTVHPSSLFPDPLAARLAKSQPNAIHNLRANPMPIEPDAKKPNGWFRVLKVLLGLALLGAALVYFVYLLPEDLFRERLILWPIKDQVGSIEHNINGSSLAFA